MNTENKKNDELDATEHKSLSLTLSVVLFLIDVIVFGWLISKIPAGHEMGAIGIAFNYLFIALVVFVVTVILIYRNTNVNLKLLFLFSSILLHFGVGYFTCIYQSPIQPIGEQKQEYLKRIKEEYPTNQLLVTDKLRTGTFYYPKKAVKEADSSRIHSWFIQFMNRKLDTLDQSSTYLDSISNYFHCNFQGLQIAYFNMFKKSFLNTFKINHLSYSPNHKYLICFTTFATYYTPNRPISASSIVFVGIKKANQIELYPITINDENWVYKQDVGFHEDFIRMTNDANGLGQRDFWKQSSYFQQYTVNNRRKFNFQLCNRGNNLSTCVPKTAKNDLLVKEPIVISW